MERNEHTSEDILSIAGRGLKTLSKAGIADDDECVLCTAKDRRVIFICSAADLRSVFASLLTQGPDGSD